MGLVIGQKDIDTLQKIADRERAPMYQVGDVTGDHRFTFESKTGAKPMDFALKTFEVLKSGHDRYTIDRKYTDLNYSKDKISTYLEQVLESSSL
jgi:phosphoribosylformylglycinamidine synthase